MSGKTDLALKLLEATKTIVHHPLESINSIIYWPDPDLLSTVHQNVSKLFLEHTSETITTSSA